MFKSISIADLINQTEKQDFLVDRFEDMVEPEHIEFPHKHDFYEILWITKGKSEQNIDYKSYTISDNTLFFISPGQLHLFEEWENIEGFIILFREEFFLQIFQNKNILFELSYLDNLHENPFLKLKKEDETVLKPIVELLYRECNQIEISKEVVQALLFVLLKNIQMLFGIPKHQNTTNHHIVLFKKFKKLVELHFSENLSVLQYASLLSVSTHHLNSIVKEVSAKTSTQIITERIALEAQQLLNFSELTITQIADNLGFSDNSYFARFFKKHTGLSPQDFRKKS
nr:helix-turn-helix domain-containing protein [uncultured Pedobacter sp.]